MKKFFVAFSIAVLLITPIQAKEPKKPNTTAKHSAAKKTTGKNSKTSKRSRGKGSARASRPARQQAPTAERYKEIQQALADKGYYSGPINGVWGEESVDALKKFQAGNNLDPDGKLGSLSIIALGLGPKREGTTAVIAKPQGTP